MIERGKGRPQSYLVNNKPVASVTEILSRFKRSDKLMNWAHRCGLQGRDWRQVRDRAAGGGNDVHAAIEMHIHGEQWKPNPHTNDQTDKTYRALEAFKEWHDGCGLTWVATEIPLVSQTHKFGGTLDGMLRDGDYYQIFDIKTSKAVFEDHIYQLGAYSILWEENKGTPVNGGMILRVRGGDEPDVEEGEKPKVYSVWFDQQAIAMAAHTFLLMLQLYQMTDKMERLARKANKL